MSQLSDKQAVLSYLHTKGWKLSQSSLYNHIERGYLREETGGGFLQAQVDTYAAGKLKRNDGSISKHKTDKLTRLTIEEKEESIKKTRLHNEKAELEMKALRENWIKREDFERELAGRAGVIDATLRHSNYSNAAEIIALVGGVGEKTNDLVDYLNQKLDSALTEFATADRFQVVVMEG